MIRDVESFLKTHYPFSTLPERALEALSFHITIRFFGAGEKLFEEGGKPLSYLYIVRKGAVSLEVDGTKVDLLVEGDTFGYPSLLSGEPPTATAVAEKDSILYLLPGEVFLKTVEKYEEFELFFAKSLARKLSATARLLRIPSRTATLDRFLTLRVKDLRLSLPIFLKGSDTVHKASKLMRERNTGCVLVLGREPGIVTERDIIKKVVSEGRDPSSVRLSEIMSCPVIGVDEKEFIFDAVLRMSRENIRRLAVFRDGGIVGILEDRDIILSQSYNLPVIVKEIERAESVEDLRYIYSLTTGTVINLLAEGLNALQIGRLISEVNDRIMGRVFFLTLRKIQKEPPCPFSIMVLGSEGRREQTLKTDQDNALIYDDSVPSLEEEPQDYFRRFGKAYIGILTDVGFPPCPGGVMLSNPEWCMSLSEWKRTIREWIKRPDPENTLRVGIFFDFRNAYGEEVLTEELRNKVFEELEGKDLFISYMLHDALRFRVQAGFTGWLISRLEGKGGKLDIKKNGIFPITQGIRALSLRARIRATETTERIEKLLGTGDLPPDLGEDLKEAFSSLQTLRLQHQAEQLREGRNPDNLIETEKLGKLEGELLKESLKIVKSFQDFIERRYTSHLQP